MSLIQTGTSVATLINVFTVEPARQHELVELLDEATEQTMRHQPGFVSANIHASLDGTKVVNYAQWASAKHFEAMLANPDAGEHMSRAMAMATAEPHLYHVTSVHE